MAEKGPETEKVTVEAGPNDFDLRIWNCELFVDPFDWFQDSDIKHLSWNNGIIFLVPQVDSGAAATVSYAQTP